MYTSCVYQFVFNVGIIVQYWRCCVYFNLYEKETRHHSSWQIMFLCLQREGHDLPSCWNLPCCWARQWMKCLFVFICESTALQTRLVTDAMSFLSRLQTSRHEALCIMRHNLWFMRPKRSVAYSSFFFFFTSTDQICLSSTSNRHSIGLRSGEFEGNTLNFAVSLKVFLNKMIFTASQAALSDWKRRMATAVRDYCRYEGCTWSTTMFR